MVARFLLGFLLLISALLSSGNLQGQSPDFKAENSGANLKAYFELLFQTIHEKKDARQGAALFQKLVLNEARAKKALKDDIAPDLLQKIVEQHKKMVVSEADVAKLCRPEQKVVRVHAATTEELAKYAPGSVAYTAFPGGAQRLAEAALRPGITFYEVEFLEPGKEAGIKYHLFYWDGNGWAMLGPMWRLVK